MCAPAPAAARAPIDEQTPRSGGLPRGRRLDERLLEVALEALAEVGRKPVESPLNSSKGSSPGWSGRGRALAWDWSTHGRGPDLQPCQILLIEVDLKGPSHDQRV